MHLVSRYLPRRLGIWVSLALLAIPTSLLAIAPDLLTFTALRVCQGVFMAAAFTLTMAYLAEHCSAEQTATALAAYITGVVASNLVGRLVAASIADLFGLATSFYFFAVLNLAGAALVVLNLEPYVVAGHSGRRRSPLASWGEHLRNPALRATFGIGFLILFAFIGIFTYVNFVLAREPISIDRMSLGLVYLVFLPAMVTTPLAGRAALRLVHDRHCGAGCRRGRWIAFLLLPSLPGVLIGMVLVGDRNILCPSHRHRLCRDVRRKTTRAAASGLYLASYYLGGLAGAAVLGQIFDRYGWGISVAAIGGSLVLAGLLAMRIEHPVSSSTAVSTVKR